MKKMEKGEGIFVFCLTEVNHACAAYLFIYLLICIIIKFATFLRHNKFKVDKTK